MPEARGFRGIELTDTWPSLAVEFELAPWHWFRFWWYRDDIEPYWSLIMGPLKITFMANRPWFHVEPKDDHIVSNTSDSGALASNPSWWVEGGDD